MRKQSTIVSSLIILTALATPSKSLAISAVNSSILAHSFHSLATLPGPKSVPSVDTLKIHSSTSNLGYALASENQAVIEMASQQKAIPLVDKGSRPVAQMAAATTTSSASEKVGKAETEAYPSEEKSTYPITETALAQSSYAEGAYSSNFLPWWRWLTLLPFGLIFLWSLLKDHPDDVLFLYSQSSDET